MYQHCKSVLQTILELRDVSNLFTAVMLQSQQSLAACVFNKLSIETHRNHVHKGSGNNNASAKVVACYKKLLWQV
jgi:hypothetical protein